PAARPVSTATMSREKKACRRTLMMRTSRTAIATTAIVSSSQTGRSARTSSSMGVSVDGWGGGGGAGSVGPRGGLRGGAELGQELRHLRVGLVAVGDELGGGRLVVVAEEALAVLDALAVRGHGVGEDLRGGQAIAEGVLEGHEAVRVDVQAGLVSDREG